MSDFKIAGACTLCNSMCFEVVQVYDEHERLPGEPKKLGQPLEGATRIVFLLMDGTKMGLTFCAECADAAGGEFGPIWKKVMRSWLRELAEKPHDDRNPEWFKKQFPNGLLCEIGREPWIEVMKNG